MSGSRDECIAAFPRTQVCTDRVYSRLLSWAGYIGALPMPPTDTAPDVEWVRERVLASRVPANASSYTMQAGPYLLELPVIVDKIRTHLNAWNDDTTETELVADIDSGLAVVMPQLAEATITDMDVSNWCTRNGYPIPPGMPTPPTPPT